MFATSLAVQQSVAEVVNSSRNANAGVRVKAAHVELSSSHELAETAGSIFLSYYARTCRSGLVSPFYSPPPFLKQRYGNLQTLPRPTAYAMHDMAKSN